MDAALYLFDIDGTLLHAGGAGRRALDQVFAARWGIADAMRGIGAGGRTDPWLVAQVFERRLGRAPTAAELDEVLDAYVPALERELAARADTLEVIPHAVEAVAWLGRRAGLGLGIATGNVARGARLKLARAGLDDRFGFGGYGCDSADRAQVVAAAIERGRAVAGACDAARIVVVGDTVHDVAAARACGVRVVAVATGSDDRATLDGAGADAVLGSLAELPAWHRAALDPAAGQ